MKDIKTLLAEFMVRHPTLKVSCSYDPQIDTISITFDDQNRHKTYDITVKKIKSMRAHGAILTAIGLKYIEVSFYS